MLRGEFCHLCLQAFGTMHVSEANHLFLFPCQITVRGWGGGEWIRERTPPVDVKMGGRCFRGGWLS